MRNKWLLLAVTGCVLVVLTMLAVALVVIDKPHFGWMVNHAFPVFVSIGVMAGAAAMLVAAWQLPGRWTWRGITLMAWALIALTSPVFGYLILLPWGVLLLALPLVAVILHQARARTPRAGTAPAGAGTSS